MPKLIKTIWITVITLFAMLTTSFVSADANSRALLKAQQIQTRTAQSHQNLDLHTTCPEHEASSEQAQVDPHCSGSNCLLKIPSVRSIVNPIEQPQSLALIQSDNSSKPVVRAQLLYRPPIS